MTSIDWRIVDIRPGHCIATWDSVHIYVAAGEFTEAVFAALAETLHEFVAANAGKQSLYAVSIIARGAPPPPEHLRGRLASLYRQLSPRVKQVIVIPEGGGFRMAMVRGVCIALSAVSPRSFRFSFVGAVRDAGDVLAHHLGSPTVIPQFERIVELMRLELADGVIAAKAVEFPDSRSLFEAK